MATVEDIAAFAGTNGDYYARAWQRLVKSQGAGAGFNGAAFFFNVGWMLYRRMYDLAAAYGTFLVAEAVVSDWYFTTHLHLTDSPKSWDLLIRVIIAVTAGQFGNRWYLQHAARTIDYARKQGADPMVKGGTSWKAAIIGTLGILIAAVLAFVAVDLATGAYTS
jgi:hypothetical protein